MFHQDEMGNGLHIILNGSVQILQMNENDRKLDMEESKFDKNKNDTKKRIKSRKYYNANFLSTMSQGDVFGETSLLTNNPRNATARAGEHGLTTLFIASKLYRKIEKASGGQLGE